MGDYEDILAADPADRARLRAAVIHRLGKLEGRSVERGPFTVSITDGPMVEGHSVTLSVKVVRTATGVDVTPPTLNPITIVNPPLLVPDPNGPIERKDDEGNVVGTYRFDPFAALLQQIRDLR